MTSSVRRLVQAIATAGVGACAFYIGTTYGQSAPPPGTATAAPGSGSAAIQRGRGARGGLPNASPAQAALAQQLTAGTAAQAQAASAARRELVALSLAAERDDAGVGAKLEALQAAEKALARARAEAIAAAKDAPEMLTPQQIAALAAGTGGNAVTNPADLTSAQVDFLTQMTGITQKLTPAVNAARAQLASAAFAQRRDDAAIEARLADLVAAERALATARAEALAKFQATKNKLTGQQLATFAASGGVIVSGSFSEPQPLDFNDHAGYRSIFDGKTLTGWDGNPKFWRVEEGAIVGESTAQNPSGNSYIAYRDVEAKDFTLKFEIKIIGSGGSGMQYRSRTGVPWLTAIPANVAANVGPVNLDWMMTGPQADFWPSRDTTAKYSGQFYSENTPMRIMAWRGQVVEGFGMGPRRLLGNIGDRTEMAKVIRQEDWNQYTVVARGGTFLHLINGQLMAVMIDDDPESSNNRPGQIGIEIEATTKVFVRNIWLKKLN